MADTSREFEEVHPPLTIGSAPPEHSEPPLPPEQSDVGIALPVAIGLVVLVLMGIGMGVSAWLLFDRPTITYHAPPSPLAFLDDPTPAPHLQYDPPADLIRLQAMERELLGSYGWVDRPQNVVRIPIERALELTAERGLPATVSPADQPSDPRAPAEADASEAASPATETPATEEAPASDDTPQDSPAEEPAAEEPEPAEPAAADDQPGDVR